MSVKLMCVPWLMGVWIRLVASDPGRVRLNKALTVAVSVLLSVSAAGTLVHIEHSDKGLLVVAGVLAMVSTVSVKDTTPRARALTAVYQVAPAVACAMVAVLLQSHRPIQIVAITVVSGLAIAARRFGARGGAMGMSAFMAYFLILVTHPTTHDLPVVTAVVLLAGGACVLVRSVLLRERPRHQILLLSTEFRAAASAAIASAGHLTASPRQQGLADDRLRQMRAVSVAISDWQDRFTTSAHIAVDADVFSERLFDARVSVEQSCSALWALHTSSAEMTPAQSRAIAAGVAELQDLLSEHPRTRDAGRQRAERPPGRGTIASPGDLALTVLDQAVLQMDSLRSIDLTRPLVIAPEPALTAPTMTVSTPDDAESDHHTDESASTRDDRRWARWQPSSRMAVQVMVAVLLACTVGELISASRWYWAVLTAFLMFIGVNNRAAVLTRATHRIVGTVAGVIVGLFVVFLTGHHTPVQLALCVLCVFLAFYLGPLSYTYLVLFVTVMLASLFAVLGVLTWKVVEWRIEETVAGAICGVACAYLIVSSSSRPQTNTAIASYFAALSSVVTAASDALRAPGGAHSVVAAVATLDRAQTDVMSTLDSVRFALLFGAISKDAWTRDVVTSSARPARIMALASKKVTNGNPDDLVVGHRADVIGALEDRTRADIARAAHVLTQHAEPAAPPTEPDSRDTPVVNTSVVGLVSELRFDLRSPQLDTVLAMTSVRRAVVAADAIAR